VNDQALGIVLLELASRKEDDSEKVSLLVEARSADPSCDIVRERLLAFLCSVLESDGEVDDALLVTLIFEKEDTIPPPLLPKLKLKPEALRSVPPHSLLKLAEQLMSAGRASDASCIAVEAAKAHDLSGEVEASQKAYVRAYHMDRRNEAASHGVVEMCSATIRRCEELTTKNRALGEAVEKMRTDRERVDRELVQLRETVGAITNTMSSITIEWDVSSIDVSNMTGSEIRTSTIFNILGSGMRAVLAFQRKAVDRGGSAFIGVYLVVDGFCSMDFTIAVDEDEKHCNKVFKPRLELGEGQSWASYGPIGDGGHGLDASGQAFRRKDNYNMVRVTIRSFKVEKLAVTIQNRRLH
jgi:hypothetical protein